MPDTPKPSNISQPASTPVRTQPVWTLLAMPVLLVVAAAAWSAFWFYATSRAGSELDLWRGREAKAGRVYECGSRSIGGFPFRLEVRCNDTSVVLNAQTAEQAAARTLVTARLPQILVVAQIYDPTRLIAEFTGPATFADLGQSPSLEATWRVGRASVAGLPRAPERASLVFDDAALEAVNTAGRTLLVSAGHVELHGRLAPSSEGEAVLETVMQFAAARSPGVHPVLAAPFDADIRAQLRGLKDFAPKPWPQRFRDIQAAGGRIDVTQSRVQQGELIAIAAGSLALTASGHLDGQLSMTVAGIETVIPALGLDRLLAPTEDNSVSRALGALDRLIPGLGNVARQNAGAAAAAGIAMLGQPTTLEGRKALTLPLKFSEGAMSLGPMKIAQTLPLF